MTIPKFDYFSNQMTNAKSVIQALFCEFSEACRDAVDFIVKTGVHAFSL